MSDLRLDVRDAWRQLSARPAHTALMVLTLALGIGGNTAVFTIVDHALLRPPPFAHVDRLVDVLDWDMVRGGGGSNLSPQKIHGWQAQPAIFERFEGFSPTTVDVTAPGDAARLVGTHVSTGLFAMLGTLPRLGRPFNEHDGRAGAERVVILGDHVWRSRFASDPAVLGRVIVLNDEDFRIVGVMPRSFRLSGRHDDFYLPVDVATATTETAGSSFYGLARLAAGVSVDAAQTRADEVARQLQQSVPLPRTWGLRLFRKQVARVDRSMATLLFVLLGSVTCVLLIACVNVANMRLSSMAARARETAVRSALGASRVRLVRGSLVETLMLAGIGAVCGFVLAWVAVASTVRLGPSAMAFPRTTQIGIDGRVLSYVVILTIATAFVFGLLPAIRGSRSDLDTIMRGSSAGVPGGRRGARWSGALVALQAALAVVLLVGAALMMRTFVNLHAINPGFPLEGLTLFELDLPTNRYPSTLSRVGLLDELGDRIAAVPGILGAAFAGSPIPSPGEFALGGGGFSMGLHAEGVTGDDSSRERVGSGLVSTTFFDVVGLRVLAGRPLTASDGDDAIVVNEALARRFWPSQSPIGKRIRIGSSGPWLTVEGVVTESVARIGDLELPMQLYWNAETRPAVSATPVPARPGRRFYHPVTLYVRTRAGIDAVPVFRAQLASLDSKMAIERIARAETIFDDAFDRQRFTLMVMAVFAVIALILAMAGVVGVLSHAVVTRRREIGIRMALGARGRDVLRVVAGESALAMVLGIAAGALGAVALTRTIRNLLYGVDPLDPLSFAMAASALAAAGTIACAVPAWRALKVEPAVTLRTE